MLNSHKKFHSANGKRLVLIADDEFVNREMLGLVLSDEYEVEYAEDGPAAWEIIRRDHDTLSLVLLDLMMPGMDGYELMRRLKEDEELRRIPIIVLTSERSAEVSSLKLGAADFIKKPYEMPEVIRARVQRSIELAEDSYIISSTERDELTGLLNREFFYRYAEQYDLHHPKRAMDAVTIDINHFHIVNELYGWSYGDSILRRIGERIFEIVTDLDGIAGRKDADVFLLYCPSGTDYTAIHDAVMEDLMADGSLLNRIRLRMGVYTDVDKTINIEHRFDRAKLAADGIRDNFTQIISFYDISLHDREFLEERLVADMDRALKEKQFLVYYQPKYDIRGVQPVLTSAEALVRWKHPELGMVSPGTFIPLFEGNGLIQRLDRFVWEEASRQMREWEDRFGLSLPISVNVSRIDMYAPDFIDTFKGLVSDYRLEMKNCLLEITESAYTDDSDELIALVDELRGFGFRIEMDDFGSGYSSLNMLAELPVDALKLDMKFVRNMNNSEKNIRMLKLMIDIARYLEVPVIAEGVETEEQVLTLREMGCDIVQGYYFSPPVPPEKFERFIEERIKQC
jgi:diguanylate cyclase (GGDEF)-like protein